MCTSSSESERLSQMAISSGCPAFAQLYLAASAPPAIVANAPANTRKRMERNMTRPPPDANPSVSQRRFVQEELPPEGDYLLPATGMRRPLERELAELECSDGSLWVAAPHDVATGREHRPTAFRIHRHQEVLDLAMGLTSRGDVDAEVIYPGSREGIGVVGRSRRRDSTRRKEAEGERERQGSDGRPDSEASHGEVPSQKSGEDDRRRRAVLARRVAQDR